MRLAKFGPFNLQESRAISTSNPIECIEHWRDRVHLESAGVSALGLAGINSRCRSHHFGGRLSTVRYQDGRMLLCQVDGKKGIYITTEETANALESGLAKLVELKLDPDSGLNIEISKIRDFIRKRISEIPEGKFPESHKKYIAESRILEPIDREVLLKMKDKLAPSYFGRGKLEAVVTDLYSDVFGRHNHIGMALDYFGCRTSHLLKRALKERREVVKLYGTFGSAKIYEQVLREEVRTGHIFTGE